MDFIFKLNTAGWVTFNPFYEGAGIKRAKEGNQIFARDTFDGKLRFRSDEYNTLDTLKDTQAKVGIKVFLDSTEIFEGKLNLWGVWNTDLEIDEFTIETVDEYQSILDNIGVNYNILQAKPIISCRVQNTEERLDFSIVTQTTGSSLWFTVDFNFGGPFDIYARQKRIYLDVQADELIGTDGWILLTDNDDGTKTLVRTWENGGFQVPVLLDDFFSIESAPNPQCSSATNDQVTYNTELCTFLTQFLALPDPGTLSCLLLRNETYYTDTEITYTRLRVLQDVIEYIVGQMDSNVLFDDDSFTYLDTNPELAYLLIGGITDCILDSGVEKSNAQTIGNLSFERLFNMLEGLFHIYWELELISNDYYFRIKHISEVSLSLGSGAVHDLTDYKNTNWTEDKNTYSYKSEEKFNRITRDLTASNPDFLGLDILIPSLDEVFPETKDIPVSDFYFDILDIINNGAKYPDESTNQFVLLSSNAEDDDPSISERNLLSSFGDIGWDSFVYSDIFKRITATNTSGYANCTSNAITTMFNNQVVIRVSLSLSSGVTPEIVISNGINTETHTLETGPNYFYFTVTEIASLIIGFQVTGASSFQLLALAVAQLQYECRVSEGVLSGSDYSNADVSLANIDENYGKWEMPDTPATINSVPTTVNKKRDKEQIEINAPIYNQNLMNFSELVKTDLANLEPIELKINFNKAFAEFKGEFL